MRTLGFIGPGTMGAPMARRLQSAGFDLVAWARRPERAAEVEATGLPTGTLSQVAGCDVLVSCLRDTNAVETVFAADGPLLANLRATLVIEHATVSPSASRSVADLLAARGISYLDAPVSGGPAGARSGSLVTMVGAPAEAFDLALPYLEPTCASIVHLGPNGAGVTLKLINQLLVAVHSVAAAEAAVLVRRAGLDPEIALTALQGGWADSTRLELQLVDSAREDFGPDGADLDPFLDVLAQVRAFIDDAQLASTLLPAVQKTWEAAAALHPEGRLAALASAYAESGPGPRPDSRTGRRRR